MLMSVAWASRPCIGKHGRDAHATVEETMFDETTTRRVFLQKGLTMLAVGATVPTFLDQTVLAIANPLDTRLTQAPSGKDGKVLVVVQLAGGNDGLNTVIPYADDAYQHSRRTLAVGGSEVLKVNDYL